jgi:hypothetical protein
MKDTKLNFQDQIEELIKTPIGEGITKRITSPPEMTLYQWELLFTKLGEALGPNTLLEVKAETSSDPYVGSSSSLIIRRKENGVE